MDYCCCADPDTAMNVPLRFVFDGDYMQDEHGEVVNSVETYIAIAKELGEGSVLIGWTDEKGSHYDILFNWRASFLGANFQGGVRRTDLFVSVMRRGSFGFEIEKDNTHYSYYGEKLNLGDGSLGSKDIAELINGVKKALNEKYGIPGQA